MNYLQLCQRLVREAGISGTGPSAVTSQSGEMRRVVDWVASSWDDIQLKRPNWNWLRASFSFNTTANDYDYTAAEAGIASRFSRWDPTSIRVYKTSLGVNDGTPIGFLPYVDYRTLYLTGAQTASRPQVFSIGPDLKLLLAPKPDAIYTVLGEYWKAPQTLSADADEPEMPSQYHEAIVYRALMRYARFEAAGEIYEDARIEYRRLIRQLELQQLPSIAMPDALV